MAKIMESFVKSKFFRWWNLNATSNIMIAKFATLFISYLVHFLFSLAARGFPKTV